MSLTMDDLNKAENDIEKVCIEANRHGLKVFVTSV